MSYVRKVTYVIQELGDRWDNRAQLDQADPYIENGEKGQALIYMQGLKRLRPEREYRLIVRILEEFPVLVPEEGGSR